MVQHTKHDIAMKEGCDVYLNDLPKTSPDVFWCTADVGWVTGHSYGIYGPLLNAATSVLFEGIRTLIL